MTRSPTTPSATPGSPVTVITGGSSGIGAATAAELIQRGHRIVVTGRDKAKLDRVVAELQHDRDDLVILAAPGDACDPLAVATAIDLAQRSYGRLDNVVANAGFSTHDSLLDGDPDRWQDMLLTNVLGPMVLIQAALPALRATRGRIVLIGSVAGLKNSAGNVYSVTKWAVTGLAENTRLLVTGDGIGVTLVAPGRVATPFWQRDGANTMPAGPALSDHDVAASVSWALDQPLGVDINTVVIRPIGQAV
ncbi:MAG: family oxidoreductase [Frankiales bacterium]|nr:family oxidoreductase [Frankiales bacterium]